MPRRRTALTPGAKLPRPNPVTRGYSRTSADGNTTLGRYVHIQRTRVIRIHIHIHTHTSHLFRRPCVVGGGGTSCYTTCSPDGVPRPSEREFVVFAPAVASLPLTPPRGHSSRTDHGSTFDRIRVFSYTRPGPTAYVPRRDDVRDLGSSAEPPGDALTRFSFVRHARTRQGVRFRSCLFPARVSLLSTSRFWEIAGKGSCIYFFTSCLIPGTDYRGTPRIPPYVTIPSNRDVCSGGARIFF